MNRQRPHNQQRLVLYEQEQALLCRTGHVTCDASCQKRMYEQLGDNISTGRKR